MSIDGTHRPRTSGSGKGGLDASYSLAVLLHEFRTGIPRAQLARLAEQTPVNTAVTLLLVLTILVTVETLSTVPGLYLWGAVQSALIVVVYLRWRKLSRRPPLTTETNMILTRSGLRHALLWAALSGGMWGSLTAFLPDLPPHIQMGLILVMGGMAAGAATTLAAVPQVAIIFILGCSLPVTLYHLATGDQAGLLMALVFTIFTGAMLGTSRVTYKAMIRQIRAENQASELKDAGLLQRLATVANEAKGLDEALQACLDEVCHYTGWPVGHVYLLSGDESCELVSSGIWHVDNKKRFMELCRLTAKTGFGSGEGFPGRVLADAEPIWSADGVDTPGFPLTLQDGIADSEFPRSAVLAEAGINAILGFPICIGDKVTAVLEFFAYDTTRPTDRLMDTLATVATILGRAIERQRSDVGLRNSEEKFRTLIESSAQGMAVHRDGKFLYVNEEGARNFGYDADEFLALGSVFDVVHPDHHDEMKAIAAARMAGEPVPDAYQFDGVHKDGHIITLYARSNTIDWQGQTALLMTSVDVTERKKVEEQHRLLLESTAEAIYGIDLEGTCTFVNPACVTMLGYKDQSELLGRNMHLLMHHTRPDGSEYPTKECRIYQAFRDGKGTHVVDEVLWRADGSSFPAEYWSHPITRNGEVIGSVVTFLDITDRRQAEEATRQEEARLSGILDLAVEAVICIGEDQRVQIFNRGAEVIFGYDAQEVIGQPLEMLLPESTRDVHGRHIEHFEASDVPRQMGSERSEIIGIRKDGSEFAAEASISRVEIGGEPVFTATLRDLTERKEAEAALRNSEKGLANAQRIAHIGSWEWDIPSDRVSWSDENFRIHNLKPQEVTPNYKMFMEFIHPDDRAKVESAVRAALDEDKPYLIDHRTVLPNGDVRILREQAEVYRDDLGKAIRMAGTAQDITEQRQAEEAVLREKAQAEEYLNIAGSLIMALDAEGRIMMMNDTARKMLDCETEDVVGRIWIDSFAPENERDQRYQTYLDWIADGGQEIEAKTVNVVTRAGKHLLIKWHNRAICDQAGKTIGMLCSGEDITESTKAEGALRTSEARYRRIIDTTNEGFWRVDENMKIIEVNEAICTMFGYGREELLGKSPFDFSVDAVDSELESQVEEAIRLKAEVRDMEFQFRRRDGSLMYVRVSANNYVNEDGKSSGRFAFITDISEQKARDAQLRQAQKMEAVGQLTSGIAHDFNNMLAVVMGNLEMAEDALPKGTDIERYLSMAMQGAQKGADLNRQLLTFSRQQVVEEKVVDVYEIIGGMSGLLGRALGEDVELEIASCNEGCFSKLDPAQLESAILNLSINARDAMPGGGKLKIETGIEQGSSDEEMALVHIAISDTGMGMVSEVQERALEPFYTTKEVGAGSGLGLSMVYGFVTQAGGQMEIDSAPEKGTIVHLRLPVADKADEAAGASGVDDMPTAVRGEVVLVVEDQKDVRDVIVSYLSDLGYEVLEARDGPRAIKILKSFKSIDLILSDIVLPGDMGGEEVVSKALAILPKLKSLHMSGNPLRANDRSGDGAAFTPILRKPFRKIDLARAVRGQLDQD